MIPISKPYIGKLENRYIQKVLNSKVLVDGYFQQKVEKIIVLFFVVVQYKNVLLVRPSSFFIIVGQQIFIAFYSGYI
jgi:dTDP-4-amino-4,6-dideoxygalactose transaminase